MPQFTLTANACAFTGHGDGVRCRQHEPLKTPLAVEHLGARNCDELAQALRAFHGGVGLRYGGSYFSHAHLERGGRAPAGYRQGRWLLECDRDASA
jgi:hypothetical protein